MNDLISVIVGLAGVMIVVCTAMSAAQTFVVPRGTPMLITRWVFLAVRGVFVLLFRSRDYRARDHAWAMFAPATLLALPAVWLALMLAGFTLLFVALLCPLELVYVHAHRRRDVSVTTTSRHRCECGVPARERKTKSCGPLCGAASFGLRSLDASTGVQ